MAIFAAFPWLAIVVAAIFAAMWRFRRGRASAVAAFFWLAYGLYEYLIVARILCAGECNIRIDLLLIYPALAIISLIAVVGAAIARARGNR